MSKNSSKKRNLSSAARLLGQKGGRITASLLTPEQRRDRASRGGYARWARQRERKAQEAAV